MTEDGWTEHVRDLIQRLPLTHFRELIVDVWGLRGFDVAGRYEGEDAEFLALRGPRHDAEAELVAVRAEATTADADALTKAAADVEDFDAVPVLVAQRVVELDETYGRKEENNEGKGDETKNEGDEDGKQDDTTDVHVVNADRLARLLHEGGYLWSLYRWVALSEASEGDVVAETSAPVRYEDSGDGSVRIGRSTAGRLGAGDGDIVRVGGEAAGGVRKGGLLETDRDYVAVGETYKDAVGVDEGEEVTVERLDTGEAHRVYILSVPEVDDELAAEIWKGHAPHAGAELAQPYADGEVRTMALEVLPDDYHLVTEETDVVIEGYAGARRVFEV